MYSCVLVTAMALFLLWHYFCKKDIDDMLVEQYRKKIKSEKRVVLIIESYKDIDGLLAVLRCILNQDRKVDSIVVISSDKEIGKHKLIRNTCVLNKIGGLSFLFKESGDDTVLVFVFSEGFNFFQDPQFLGQIIESNTNQHLAGVIKVHSSEIQVQTDKIYQ